MQSETERLPDDERGFTFLELLLVLSVTVILTAVILPFSEKRLRQTTEEDALKQFIAAVHEAQLYAMTHRDFIYLILREGGQEYMVRNEQKTILFEGAFPEGMYIGGNRNLKELAFTPTGYLQTTGKMIIITKSRGKVTITFQFEKGRMVIRE